MNFDPSSPIPTNIDFLLIQPLEKKMDPRVDISIWRRSVYKTPHLFKQYLLSLSLRGTNNLQSVQ